MQNAAFEALGLDFVYVAFDVGLDRAADAVAALRTLGIRGANVTMPLKRAIAPLLDRLAPAARMAGAVNVIVNDDGLLTGHITDGEGFMMSLDEAGVAYAGRKMTLIGAGGAATAVAIQAAMQGVRSVVLFNRRDDFFAEGVRTAALLRDEFGCDAAIHPLEDETRLREVIAGSDLMVQGTSLGMEETRDRSVIPEPSFLHPGLVVCDLIYVPRETKLLRMAKEAGCRTVSGIGMQLFQAVSAFRAWTGRDMPIEVAREALYE